MSERAENQPNMPVKVSRRILLSYALSGLGLTLIDCALPHQPSAEPTKESYPEPTRPADPTFRPVQTQPPIEAGKGVRFSNSSIERDRRLKGVDYSATRTPVPQATLDGTLVTATKTAWVGSSSPTPHDK